MSQELEQEIVILQTILGYIQTLRGKEPPAGYKVVPIIPDGVPGEDPLDEARFVCVPVTFQDDVWAEFVGKGLVVYDDYDHMIILDRECWGRFPEEACEAMERVC